MVPQKWLQAIVYPIPKDRKNDARIPMNYRGISLLSTLSKVYTSLMNLRLQCFLEKGKILVDEQNGFRKKRSCQDHVFTLTSVVRNRKRQNLSTFSAFIDMRKAFDYVNRNLLLYKLLKTNVDGHMYNAIRALYQNTSACVQINEHFTGWFPTLSGVRQGDNLSPTLFSLFLNDLALELKQMNCGVKISGEDLCILMYADDIVVLSDSEENLQKLLHRVRLWCKRSQLVINEDKSKVIHFRKKVIPRSLYEFKVGNQSLNTVEKYKYLGVVLDEFLDFSKVSDSLAVGGSRALGSINAKFRILKNMGVETYTKLFENCVMPVLHYSAGVWGLQSLHSLQNVQNRAMRFYLGTHKFTPTLGMLGDLGWYPLELYRKIEAVRLWNRFINMSDDRITKKIFMWDVEECQRNWSAEIKKVLYDVQMSECFDNMNTCNIKDLSDVLMKNFEQDWLEKVQDKVKLRSYKLFKTSFGTEKYLKINLDRSERSFTAQLRLGILPIKIETGRFTRTPVNERLCQLCNSNIVEDENHFLHHCTKYTLEREVLYTKAHMEFEGFQHLSDTEKTIFLFENQGRQIAKYIKRAYNIRFQTINH
jgi:hypothetical protein